MKTSNVFILFFLGLLLFSCGSKTEIPLWKITSKTGQISYLAPSSNHLTKEQVNTLLPDTIIQVFNRADTYISFWDLEKSDFLNINKLVAIGNDKTLKDTLQPAFFNTLKNQIPASYPVKPENSPLKLQFYIHDYLNAPSSSSFNMDLFWFKQAMPQQKQIKGLISYQDFYALYNKIDISTCEHFITQHPLNKYKKAIKNENENLFTSAGFTSTNAVKNSYDIFFSTITKEKLYNKWFNNIKKELDNNTCFISLDGCFTTKNESFIDFLLSKGYKITLI